MTVSGGQVRGELKEVRDNMIVFTEELPNDMPKDEPDPILNPKQQKLVQYLLDGDNDKLALTKAGYSPGSLSRVAAVKGYVRKIIAQRQKVLEEQTISKGECIQILKEIAKTAPDRRTKIMAIQQLGKFLGYEAPVKNENTNENISRITIVEDKDNGTEDEDNGL